jgi:hypothetical protein
MQYIREKKYIFKMFDIETNVYQKVVQMWEKTFPIIFLKTFFQIQPSIAQSLLATPPPPRGSVKTLTVTEYEGSKKYGGGGGDHRSNVFFLLPMASVPGPTRT